MSAWLASALDRLPPPARRAAVVVAALLALGAVAGLLTLTPRSRVVGRRPHQPANPPNAATSTTQRHRPPPVPAAQLLGARLVAERFLAGYLPFAYGRASRLAVSAITPALRRRLSRARAQLTPVERRRHPQVVSIELAGTAPGVVLAVAIVEDDGISTYPLRFTLQRHAGGWQVSGADEG